MQLFQSVTSTAQYEIVYDIYPFTDKLYLPVAYVVSTDRDGYLAHIRQRALPGTIKSFGIENNPIHNRLFDIVALLQPKALEAKFQPANKRKPIPLEQLLQERARASAIAKYVHRLMDELLDQATRHQYFISWQVDRKVLVKDFILTIEKEPLNPLLYFQKEQEGIRYRLQLESSKGAFAINTRDVVPITNHPAWLVVDYHLYRVPDINGNMVRPFQNKEEVYIPEKSVKTYFQKFILKVAAKAEIEAEGFEVVQEGQLQRCELKPVKDIFSDRWLLGVQMIYPNVSFGFNNPREKSTRLFFDEDDHVRIIQTQRDQAAEQIFLDHLQRLNLISSGSGYFAVEQSEDNEYALIEWLSEHRYVLEEKGFKIADAIIEDKTIRIEASALDLKAERQNDWFDLYGQVRIGDQSIPFLSLAKNIRAGNRLYVLPDGSLFVIPQEWMARYKGLFQFGKQKQQHLKLAKSQFPLLQEIGLADTQGPNLDTPSDSLPSDMLKAELRPYQLDGFRWLVQLYEQGLGACLADDMGLGKTLQTIAVLLHAKENKDHQTTTTANTSGQQLGLFAPAEDLDSLRPLQALIVLPASLVFNWASEINKFAPGLQIYRHTGPKRHKDIRLLMRFDIILTTYQTALRDVSLFQQLSFEYIVLDESQYIKNKDSKIFKAINQLEAEHKISLSGTPIENSLSDLWAQMQFINPGLLGSFNFFKKAFIRPIERKQDEEKKEQLRKLVAPYLLRRTKEQVARDLPDLTTKVFYAEMTAEQKRLYEREKSAARNYLLDHFQANDPKFKFQVLQSLTKLRQIANHPQLAIADYNKDSGKFNDVLAQLEVVRKGGHKALIFSSFVKHLQLYKNKFEASNQPVAWLTGSQTLRERERAIQSFAEQADVQAFLISIKAGGAGLNLTAADYVFLLDPWWNPSTEQQAIARAHRIGQDKHVIAIKFISKDTIEEKILRLQEKKAKLAEDIIGDIQKASFSKGELAYLFD
jgi:SNF2 family DNA or RNA helicase